MLNPKTYRKKKLTLRGKRVGAYYTLRIRSLCQHHRKSVFVVTCGKADESIFMQKKNHLDHICANGQITEVSSPNALTTQAATEGGGTGGNPALKE